MELRFLCIMSIPDGLCRHAERKLLLRQHTGIGILNKTTIYTKSRHVSVETLMTGYEKMESYITENVAPEKIIMKER